MSKAKKNPYATNIQRQKQKWQKPQRSQKKQLEVSEAEMREQQPQQQRSWTLSKRNHSGVMG